MYYEYCPLADSNNELMEAAAAAAPTNVVVEAFFSEAVRTFSEARRTESAEMQFKTEAVSLLVEARQQMLKLWGLSWLTP